MFDCKVCSGIYKSVMSLARHVTQAHSMTTQYYYDLFEKRSGEGACYCGSKTKFLNMNAGYQKVCGHACAQKAVRKNLKIDQSKYSLFVQKMVESQTKVWSNRSVDEKQRISDKIVESEGWLNRSLYEWKYLSGAELAVRLEKTGKADCKTMGLQLQQGVSAFNLSQVKVESNLAELIGVYG